MISQKVVSDIIPVATLADLTPSQWFKPETKSIYITMDTNKAYYWDDVAQQIKALTADFTQAICMGIMIPPTTLPDLGATGTIPITSVQWSNATGPINSLTTPPQLGIIADAVGKKLAIVTAMSTTTYTVNTFYAIVGNAGLNIYNTYNNFPSPGQAGNIYIDTSTGDIYTWNSTTNQYEKLNVGSRVIRVADEAAFEALQTAGNLIPGALYGWEGTGGGGSGPAPTPIGPPYVNFFQIDFGKPPLPNQYPGDSGVYSYADFIALWSGADPVAGDIVVDDAGTTAFVFQADKPNDLIVTRTIGFKP